MTKDSLCMKCNREVERQKKEEEKALKIKMQEMAEKRRAEEEAERQKHTALRKEEWNQRRAGIAAFDDVPRVQIGTDGKKQKAQAVSFLKVKNYKFVEVFHTMITPPRRNFQRILRVKQCLSMA